jgi:hypothetical protein
MIYSNNVILQLYSINFVIFICLAFLNFVFISDILVVVFNRFSILSSLLFFVLVFVKEIVIFSILTIFVSFMKITLTL